MTIHLNHSFPEQVAIQINKSNEYDIEATMMDDLPSLRLDEIFMREQTRMIVDKMRQYECNRRLEQQQAVGDN